MRVGFFIRKGDDERGPYDRASLEDSLQKGRLSGDTQVRAEDSEQWQPLRDALAGRAPTEEPLAAAVFLDAKATPGELNPYRPPAVEEPEPRSYEPAAREEEGGSYALGFIAGLLGGCIILFLVYRRGKPKTRTGLWIGFATQIVLALLMQGR